MKGQRIPRLMYIGKDLHTDAYVRRHGPVHAARVSKT